MNNLCSLVFFISDMQKKNPTYSKCHCCLLVDCLETHKVTYPIGRFAHENRLYLINGLSHWNSWATITLCINDLSVSINSRDNNSEKKFKTCNTNTGPINKPTDFIFLLV